MYAIEKAAVLAALVTVLVCVPAARAHEADSLWTRAYGGSSLDRAWGVTQTTDRGYVLAGETYSYGAGSSDAYLVKLDKAGDTLWTRTYGGSALDLAMDVKRTPDGGCIVVGSSFSYGPGNAGIYVLKLDSNGDTLWTRSYGGPTYDYGEAIIRLPAGGYAVAGATYSFGAGHSDMFLLRLDANGDSLWMRTYGASGYEWGFSLSHTRDGGFILAGYTDTYGWGMKDSYIVKTDANGFQQWFKSFGGSEDDCALDIIEDMGGGYILSGYTHSFGSGNNVFAVRMKSNGDSLWIHNYGSSDNDYGWSIQENEDKTYIIIGGITRAGSTEEDALLLGIDSTGTVDYWRWYGGTGYEMGTCSYRTYDGGLIIGGYADPLISGNYDFHALRTAGTHPFIYSVRDIPADQGGQVRLIWARTHFDEPEVPPVITGYAVWRGYEHTDMQSGRWGHEGIFMSRLAYPPGDWEYITTAPARCENNYACTVPTLCDSADGGICRTRYFVSALTDTPWVYFDSDPDSGYSVDNLAPGPPDGLHMPTSSELAWDEAPEEDFDYFTVYGSDVEDFETAEFIAYTSSTMLDISGDVCAYYHVTATDFAGNEGDASSLENTYAGARDGFPVQFALRENRPNPFEAYTSIVFDLPARSFVSLRVFDISGRLVRKLAYDSYLPGQHTVTWAGDDDAGAGAGAGIYFVRMDAGRFSCARKLILLR